MSSKGMAKCQHEEDHYFEIVGIAMTGIVKEKCRFCGVSRRLNGVTSAVQSVVKLINQGEPDANESWTAIRRSMEMEDRHD